MSEERQYTTSELMRKLDDVHADVADVKTTVNATRERLAATHAGLEARINSNEAWLARVENVAQCAKRKADRDVRRPVIAAGGLGSGIGAVLLLVLEYLRTKLGFGGG